MCVAVYRPSSGSKTQFREKFVSLLEDIDTNNSDIVITGDFNIHMDDRSRVDTQNLTRILSDFGLESNVSGPTQVGATL